MKDIRGFEGLYAVTEKGEVWSYPKTVQCGRHKFATQTLGGRFLSPTKTPAGYPLVTLFRERKRHYKLVSRLVAETFIPNPENKPWVLHKNDTPSDNRVENLEWGTPKSNTQDCVRRGRKNAPSGEKHWMQRTKIKRDEKGRFNGHIERYSCEAANNTKSQELFGVQALGAKND